jgi:hypothetical protein
LKKNNNNKIKIKNNVEAGWKLKFIFCFMETTHELLNLWQMKFGKIHDHGNTYKCYLNHYLLDEAFKYGDGAKFWGYAATGDRRWTILCTIVK